MGLSCNDICSKLFQSRLVFPLATSLLTENMTNPAVPPEDLRRPSDVSACYSHRENIALSPLLPNLLPNSAD